MAYLYFCKNINKKEIYVLLFSNIANFMQIPSRKEQKKLLHETQRQGSGPRSGDFGPLCDFVRFKIPGQGWDSEIDDIKSTISRQGNGRRKR